MLILHHARILDGTGAPPLEGQSIVIQGGRIAAIGTQVPADCGNHLDLQGCTVIPALIDAHTHFSGSGIPALAGMHGRLASRDYAEAREGYIRYGVLTVRTAGDFAQDMLAFQADSLAGRVRSPRVVACGPVFQAPGGHPGFTVYGADPDILRRACILVDEGMDIEGEVARVAASGASWIKAFYAYINKPAYPAAAPALSPRALARIAMAAERENLPLMVHVDDIDGAILAAELGARSVEHLINNGVEDPRPIGDSEVARLKAAGVTIVPTMFAVRQVDGTLPGAPAVYPALCESVRRLYEAGVPLGVGCDAGIPDVYFGDSLHRELACFVQAGVPPLDALRMATLGNASLLGLAPELGSVAPGKKADLVVLGSDPLENIAHTRDIRMVLQEGHILYDNLEGSICCSSI